ncbi:MULTISPECIES: adenylate/guanylate cyclase domain-containing protein [Rhizobium]|uniref:Adenylate/guanylate cyclase domain-containing protein n=1 Tax=Rhizobium brockwellii TaxID=3019932 RepID=A0ABU3YL14_9HYPH|nr:adenylate/guanylate cyclase domain-containing protein [Rhizobium brockwellii]MDV4186511.1 adenylate/guanylate cyclase domain-containing protein [Rhizobium brockwellii]
MQIGTGLHYGEVVVGNTGHTHRLEYTVLGDTVNVASRLERLTRETQSHVMASNDLVSSVKLPRGGRNRRDARPVPRHLASRSWANCSNCGMVSRNYNMTITHA